MNTFTKMKWNEQNHDESSLIVIFIFIFDKNKLVAQLCVFYYVFKFTCESFYIDKMINNQNVDSQLKLMDKKKATN